MTGNLFYALLLYQCSVYTTKAQYDHSHVILADILSKKETAHAVGKECVDAMVGLHSKLNSKDRYLAYHVRLGIQMCLDAMTISLVESMNELTKHGPVGVNANVNTNQSLQTMTNAHDSSIQRHINGAD